MSNSPGKAAPATTKPMARLRAFLQSLTTGEAGFMNVCVGSTAFAFALYKHQKEHFEQLEDEREARFHKEYDLTLDRINATKPETLLDALSWYTRALEAEAKQAGVSDPTRDELADTIDEQAVLTHRQEIHEKFAHVQRMKQRLREIEAELSEKSSRHQ